MKNKIVFYTSLLVLTMIIVSCGNKEIVVDKPNGNKIESSVRNENVQETIVVETTNDKTKLETLSIEEKEKLLNKYLDLLGGYDALEIRQYLYEVKENGEYTKIEFDSNREMLTQNIKITPEQFIDDTINEIKEKYPDIEEREGEDWDYVSSMLNLGDFGTYESAFMDCDNGFWNNSLSAGVFTDDNDKKWAYNKFIECKTMKEKATFLHNLVGDKQDTILDNEPIIEKYVDEMKKIIYGKDADKIEVKQLGITSINDRDIRFNYILGDKVTSDTKTMYYIEDSVKGYIQDGKFVRDNNPLWTDEELGLDPESVKRGMLVQYSIKDANLLNHAISLDDYLVGNRFGLDYRKQLLYSKIGDYILDVKDLFPYMDLEAINSKISNDLPVCRTLIMVDYEYQSE